MSFALSQNSFLLSIQKCFSATFHLKCISFSARSCGVCAVYFEVNLPRGTQLIFPFHTLKKMVIEIAGPLQNYSVDIPDLLGVDFFQRTLLFIGKRGTLRARRRYLNQEKSYRLGIIWMRSIYFPSPSGARSLLEPRSQNRL